MSQGNRACRTRMLRESSRGCPQQVVRVGPMEIGERHDTRTKAQHHTAADHQPTNQVSPWQAERGSRPTRRHPRKDPREDVFVSGDFTVQLATRLLDWSAGGLLRCSSRPTRLSVCRVVLEIPLADTHDLLWTSLRGSSSFETSDTPNFLVTSSREFYGENVPVEFQLYALTFTFIPCSHHVSMYVCVCVCVWCQLGRQVRSSSAVRGRRWRGCIVVTEFAVCIEVTRSSS